jgi:tetratricopeptide (TPR) repeat protein
MVTGLCSISPSANADQTDARLDPLFAQLQSITDHRHGTELSNLIWEIWLEVDDIEARQRLHDSMIAMDRGEFGSALQHFSSLIQRSPGFAEGWNRRATLHYLQGDYASSARDIKQTLLLEPRHFGALSGLGLIMMRLREPDAAIVAFEKALVMNPHVANVHYHLERLRNFVQ